MDLCFGNEAMAEPGARRYDNVADVWKGIDVEDDIVRCKGAQIQSNEFHNDARAQLVCNELTGKP